MRSTGFELMVVVVEYLGESMSKQLLCKFPDNSAFDFDYSQSSIWSPLAHRHFPPPPSLISASVSGSHCIKFNCNGSGGAIESSDLPTQRKLAYEEEEDVASTLKQVTTNIGKKIATTLFDNFQNLNNRYTKMMKQRRKNKKMAATDFSPAPVSAKRASPRSQTPRKEWAKILKVASKRFKKAGTKKKKDLTAHNIKLSNCSMDPNF